jgi:hypothetical protein
LDRGWQRDSFATEAASIAETGQQGKAACDIGVFRNGSGPLPLTNGSPAASISPYFQSEVFTPDGHFRLKSPPAPPIS